MAASVSSERAFSQGGITISKCRNRLKGDIVEALQCVKCALCQDLLFCEPRPSSFVEEEPDEYDIETVPNEKSSDDDNDEEGWEALFLEEDEDDSELDFVMED
jgi:hAT family C-terminal dimerisation region